MEFYTPYKKPISKKETFENKEQKVYREVFDKKTGQRKLVVEKTINIYDKIQEYKDEVNISKMLQKYNLNLTKQLEGSETKLVDLTNLPENLMETMQVIDDAKYIWERQSKELKARFDNDFKKFIASSENGQLADMLNKELKTAPAAFTPEVQAQMTTPMQQTVQEPIQQTVQGGINLNV